MRIVFVGASSLAVATAQRLLHANNEVIIIENEKSVIDKLMPQVDCVFMHGNGSKPAILKETDPASIDLLFCLTKSDEANIIASLVARSLGVKRVITRIEDAEFEHICLGLGLTDIIIPTMTNARYLANIVAGQDILELSAIFRGNVKVFSFIATADEAGLVSELDLPNSTRVIFAYRENLFMPMDKDSDIEIGDELVLVTTLDEHIKLHTRWGNGHDKTASAKTD